MSVQDIFQQRKVLFLKENSKMSRTIVLKSNLQIVGEIFRRRARQKYLRLVSRFDQIYDV